MSATEEWMGETGLIERDKESRCYDCGRKCYVPEHQDPPHRCPACRTPSTPRNT